MNPPSRPIAIACLALSMSLVGSYVALSKPLVAALPVFLLAWMRFGIGAVAMLHWLPKPVTEPPLTRSTRGLLFLESLLGNFLFSIFMLFGVSMTSAVSAGVIMASIPAVVALLSWAFLRERVPPRVWWAVACAVVGISLVAFTRPVTAGGVVQHSQAWLGNLFVMGAVVCEAAYAVIGKRLTGALGPRRISAIINLWGLVLVTPMGLWAAWQFDFGQPPASIWLLLVFYALAASVWSVWLWMTGLRTVPAAQAGVFTVLLPLCAAAVGVAVLGERLAPVQWLAFAIALAGVVLATLPSRTSPGSSSSA